MHLTYLVSISLSQLIRVAGRLHLKTDHVFIILPGRLLARILDRNRIVSLHGVYSVTVDTAHC